MKMIRQNRMNQGSRLWRLLLSILIILGVVVLCALVINLHVVRRGQGKLRTEFSPNDQYDCILVLGAGLRADGTPSDMLRDRLQRAVTLYEMGVSKVILLSGDRSGEEYDEVRAMEQYCIAAGIPAEALRLDHEGFSTLESIENLKIETGFCRVIVVTQSYHLYRALYIAEQMGLEADGYSADVREYRGQTLRDLREIAARMKDFFAVLFFYDKA